MKGRLESGELLPINSTQTEIYYNQNWWEIIEDQEGKPYFHYFDGDPSPKVFYFTAVRTEILVHMVNGVVDHIASNDPDIHVIIIDEDENADSDWQYVQSFDKADIVKPDAVFSDLYKEFTPPEDNPKMRESAFDKETRLNIYHELLEQNL